MASFFIRPTVRRMMSRSWISPWKRRLDGSKPVQVRGAFWSCPAPIKSVPDDKNLLRADTFRKTCFESPGAQNSRFRKPNGLLVQEVVFGRSGAIEGVTDSDIGFTLAQL